MTPDLHVVAVNRGRQVALLEDGTVIPVTLWFDQDSEECLPSDAMVCIAGSEALGFWVIDLEDFRGKLH